MPCCSNNEAYTSSSTCNTTNLVEEIKELKAQVTSLEKDLEKHHEGKSTLDNILSVQKSLNDNLDSTPVTRISPRATRRRRAKTKSRIWPRLFASSERLKGIM
jgi:chromosome segregation ATPase